MKEEEIPAEENATPVEHYDKQLLISPAPSTKEETKVTENPHRAKNAKFEEDQSCCACKLF